MNALPPGMPMIVAALLAALLPGRWRAVACLGIPVASAIHMVWAAPPGMIVRWSMMDLELVPVRADRLTNLWGAVFHVAALLGALYSFHQRRRLEQSMALVYAGSAVAALFAGDLLTLFLFWELTSLASAFLVWTGPSPRAYRAGLRYLGMQVASGLLLLAGAVFQWHERGSLSFGTAGQVGVLGDPRADFTAALVLLAFGIKAAFPLLHVWVPDAYPEATPGGTFFLSVFTTKLAVYALVRGFAGCELLIPIGCVMALVPLVYGLLANDVRRALAYCLVNQLGFMVVAAGVGSELAVNGVAAHAVGHILYKGLLFMATGAVLLSTGTARASELGALAAAFPGVLLWYLVGAASISLPGFVGSVAKSLSLAAVAEAHYQAAWMTLWAATAGVLFVCGMRIPADVFFGSERSPAVRLRRVPWNMHAAMGAAAFLSLVMGLFPQLLYGQLPHPVDYQPYTLPHVIEQLQVVAFTWLVFLGVARLQRSPFWVRGRLWDVDWVYRWALPQLGAAAAGAAQRAWRPFREPMWQTLHALVRRMRYELSDEGHRGHFAPTGMMAMAAAIILILYLLAYYS